MCFWVLLRGSGVLEDVMVIKAMMIMAMSGSPVGGSTHFPHQHRGGAGGRQWTGWKWSASALDGLDRMDHRWSIPIPSIYSVIAPRCSTFIRDDVFVIIIFHGQHILTSIYCIIKILYHQHHYTIHNHNLHTISNLSLQWSMIGLTTNRIAHCWSSLYESNSKHSLAETQPQVPWSYQCHSPNETKL